MTRTRALHALALATWLASAVASSAETREHRLPEDLGTLDGSVSRALDHGETGLIVGQSSNSPEDWSNGEATIIEGGGRPERLSERQVAGDWLLRRALDVAGAGWILAEGSLPESAGEPEFVILVPAAP